MQFYKRGIGTNWQVSLSIKANRRTVVCTERSKCDRERPGARSPGEWSASDNLVVGYMQGSFERSGCVLTATLSVASQSLHKLVTPSVDLICGAGLNLGPHRLSWCSTTEPHLPYFFVCDIYVRVYVHMHTWVWKPQVSNGCFPQLSSTLFFIHFFYFMYMGVLLACLSVHSMHSAL